MHGLEVGKSRIIVWVVFVAVFGQFLCIYNRFGFSVSIASKRSRLVLPRD